jgi:glycosyltransferase involved in cell wall biosynthesis
MATPKVLFEISVLGFAAQSANFRTGVFRMVDAWAKGLAQKSEAETPCDIQFGSFLDARTQPRSHRYWSQTALRQRPFLPNYSGMNARGALDAQLLQLSRTANASLITKIARRGLSEVLQLWDKALPQPAAPSGSFDIFHSTFWPFPSRPTASARSNRTQYLMTFVDLINLVNPKLSTDGGVFFRSVLDTVHRDDFTLSISEATRRDLLSVRPDLDPAKSFVVHLAASEIFQPQSDAALTKAALRKWALEPETYFLSVCTLERRKNIPRLIEAFEAWASRPGNPRFDLVLTGAYGNATEALQAQIAASPVRDRIRLLGFVDDFDLPALYQGSAAFVYPSLHEGFGLPVLEALQCGARVITANNSSLVEVAGQAATYCDATSKDSIIEALQTASDGTNRQGWYKKAIQQASKFSWKQSVRRLKEIYQAIADS